jgi:uncharacterized protein (DUF885 family)
MKLLAISFFIIFITTLNSHHTPTERFLELLDDHWEYSLQANPLFATGQGDHRFNDQLPETGLAAMQAAFESNKEFLGKLNEIPRDSVSSEHQVNYDIFRIQLENAIQNYEANGHLLPLNGWWDYHASFADLANRVPLRNLEDYENYLSRLRAFPEYNAGYIERLKHGAEIGFVRPQMVFGDYLESVEALITVSVEESRLFEPFENFPAQVDEENRQSLGQEAADVIENNVLLEFRKLYNFLAEEYVPAASETIGITEIPGGDAYYNYLVKYYTTVDITADDIHQTGLDEVARIRSEMMEIVESEGFGDDFDGFTNYLRTDEQFYAATPEELMKETALVLKRMDGKLPELFKTLPRLPYGIIEVPDYLAPRTATAYYSRGAADGTRAGNYAVNTYDLPSRPLYEVTALSLHEAVPGHHLQIALQQELENLPKFRTVASFTAYSEGWALYSERLGLEVGFYEGPYQNFGRLSYEMWRALRLVVDTGMHAKGWSREQAVEYMATNSALSLHNIRSEVNRYIFWPGQALAYKMGEIKIRELRETAERELGENFDLREFHDVVLLSGAVPLSVLEQNVMNWMEQINR